MAIQFQKTFSVVVTFTRDDFPSRELADTDLHAVELRAAIKEGIEKASRKSMGVYNTQPGTVSEA